MSQVTCDITISLDGFAAGLYQTRKRPFGTDRAESLHRWMFEDADANQAEKDAIAAAKAYIMGRHMYGPDRGEWDLEWRGWWGEDPPFHAPVFVLGHGEREPVEMEGGTTYTFVTDGIESALRRAKAAAGEGDVAIAGGPATINQYLRAGLIDELRLHTAPITLGAGERLFDGVGELDFELVEVRATTFVTHQRLAVR